jgi:cyclopropane-fatty-acyl-phospholipid synthase
MADRKDLDYTYSTIDKVFRMSIGEMADISGAKYDGDFTLTLEEAQKAKHKFIADQLSVEKGSKVLDMGCGWGPFLNYAGKERGADVIGLTLSEGQERACKNNGFKVFNKDCRYIEPADFGMFDSLVSVGAFEAFCSLNEFKEGKQEEIYRGFFEMASKLIPSGRRFYLQTMTFGKNMIDHNLIDINANKNSNPFILALMEKRYPGSWIPYGLDMITRTAEPYFKLVTQSNGRSDYIETISQMRKKFFKFNFKKYLLYFSLIPKYFTDRDFRYQLYLLKTSPVTACFKRELFDHYRIVFEKV